MNIKSKLLKIKLPEKLRKNLSTAAFVLILPAGILIGYFFSNIKGFVSGGLQNITAPVNKLLFVGKVDEVGITKSAWEKHLRLRYGSTAMQELTDIYMVKNELKKAGITVSDTEIDNEIANIEKQLAGESLEAILKQQGRSLSDFRTDIYMRVGMKKLLSDKVQVTDKEIEDYIKEAGTSLTGKTDEEKNNEAKTYLTDQKLSEEINKWYTDLKTKVKIENYLN